jgi:hypothetical protein
MEPGTRTAAPKMAPRSLSSGTHSPDLRSRYFFTIRSDKRPDKTPPTERFVQAQSALTKLKADETRAPMFPSPDGRKHAPIKASLVIPYVWPFGFLSGSRSYLL